MFGSMWSHRASRMLGVVGALGGLALFALVFADGARADPLTSIITSVVPDHGPVSGGQTVTVRGTGFVPSITTVDVDGLNVPALVISPTELMFVTPAHAAGSVSLEVQVDELASPAALYYFSVVPTVSATPTQAEEAGGDVLRSEDVPSTRPNRPIVAKARPVPTTPFELAATGSETGWIAALALVLLAVGIGAVVAGRPRTSGD